MSFPNFVQFDTFSLENQWLQL